MPGIADVATATLWSTMIDRFRKIQTVLDEAAPMTASLSRRVSDLPPLGRLAAKARHDYSDIALRCLVIHIQIEGKLGRGRKFR